MAGGPAAMANPIRPKAGEPGGHARYVDGGSAAGICLQGPALSVRHWAGPSRAWAYEGPIGPVRLVVMGYS